MGFEAGFMLVSKVENTSKPNQSWSRKTTVHSRTAKDFSLISLIAFKASLPTSHYK